MDGKRVNQDLVEVATPNLVWPCLLRFDDRHLDTPANPCVNLIAQRRCIKTECGLLVSAERTPKLLPQRTAPVPPNHAAQSRKYRRRRNDFIGVTPNTFKPTKLRALVADVGVVVGRGDERLRIVLRFFAKCAAQFLDPN